MRRLAGSLEMSLRGAAEGCLAIMRPSNWFLASEATTALEGIALDCCAGDTLVGTLTAVGGGVKTVEGEDTLLDAGTAPPMDGRAKEGGNGGGLTAPAADGGRALLVGGTTRDGAGSAQG